MNSKYIFRLTVAVPESMIVPANHLAVAIGESSGDFETFEIADWVDSQGNRYAVSSLQCTATLFAYAGGMLQRRDFAPQEWSSELASQAQAVIELWIGEGPIPTAEPNKIVGIVMDDPMMALQLLGVSKAAI